MARRELNETEREVWTLLAGGLTREQVAAELGVSSQRVRRVMEPVQQYLNTRNAAQTIGILVQRGWLSVPDEEFETARSEMKGREKEVNRADGPVARKLFAALVTETRHREFVRLRVAYDVARERGL